MLLDQLDVEPEVFSATGWTIKPEGACRDDMCVSLPSGAADTAGRVVVPVVAERLGMPLVHDDRYGVWALGPARVGGRALDSAVAPELTLRDAGGNPFSLSVLRGRKVLLVAWASW